MLDSSAVCVHHLFSFLSFPHQQFFSQERYNLPLTLFFFPFFSSCVVIYTGKIVSLRFLEWVRANPTGVVALPTGRTPEFFIKTLDRYKTHWNTVEVSHFAFFDGPVCDVYFCVLLFMF